MYHTTHIQAARRFGLSRRTLLVLFLVIAGEIFSPCLLLVLSLLSLVFPELPDAIGGARETPNAIGNLATSDQGSHDGSPDDEGQDETVDTVPLRRPASLGGTRVGVVEEVEDQEL